MSSTSDSTAPDLQQNCPICGASIRQNLRYPYMLCGSCMDQVTDASGRRLEFANIDATGGFQAFYADTGTPYSGHVCYVLGVRCCADEGHFGGIVIQPSYPNGKQSQS